MATTTRPTGVTTTRHYDAAGELQHQQGSTPLLDLAYTLDVNGNRTALTEQLAGSTLTTTYQYDPLQRLVTARYPALPNGPTSDVISYTLDPAGNRLSDGTTASSYDAADRIQGASYDANCVRATLGRAPVV